MQDRRQTSLIAASQQGHYAVVELLIEAGANLNAYDVVSTIVVIL